MKLFLLTTALATAIQANRLLQQFPVDSGCDNPPAGFSCLDNQSCCDIGDGVARCCNVTVPTTTVAPTCGGLENCYQYTPDGCNTCTCGSNGIAGCTRRACADTVDPNECLVCNDGFIPNDAGECETCSFLFQFAPVCCEGVTYSNSGEAACNQVSCPPGSEITDGACSTPTPAPTCGGIENCVSYTPDGCNTCSCGGVFDLCTLVFCEDTVDPNECILCEDGFRPNDAGECETCSNFVFLFDPVCCEGVTYTNSAEANCNQESCPPGSEITEGACSTETTEAPKKTCDNRRDCGDGFDCRRDPICRVTTGLGCGQVDKVCVDIDGVCEEDGDCDGDTSCLIGNRNRGLCVNYE